MFIFNLLILACWIVFIGYWIASAWGVKKDVSRQMPQGLRYFGLLVMVVAFIIIQEPYFQEKFFPQTLVAGIVALAFCASGIAFAIWARVHLGRNWSAVPAIKVGHELVMSGPYRFVRHPIYTGILFALIGSVIISAKAWLFILLVVAIMFIWRIKVEEGSMMQLFPNEYPEYKKRTKALIPFIW